MDETAGRQPDDSGEMVLMTFRVPREWRTALTGIARRQRISVADLLRIMLRGFMRERLTPEQLRALDVD